jgi:lipopolysaccharide export LptBFGC system permease protein LptF
LATLWSIFSLLKTSEIIILKTSSFSLWRLNVLYCSISVIVVTIYVMFIMPFLANMHSEYRAWEGNRAQIYENIHKKIILNNSDIAFVTIKKYDIFTHKVYESYISVTEESGLLKSVYYAAQGQYDTSQKHIQFDTIQLLKTNEKNITFPNNVTKFLLPIDLNNINRILSDKKTMIHLYEYPVLIYNQKQQNLSYRNLQISFFSLLALPLTCAIYCFIAIASLPSLYRGLQGTKNIMIALLSSLIFYLLDNWITIIAITNDLPILISIFAVKIAVILLCIVTIFNKEYGFNKVKTIELIK